MANYRFCLRDQDGEIIKTSKRACADLAEAWSHVATMACEAAEDATGRILVRDDYGEVVILVGIASARVLTAKSVSAQVMALPR
jgi:hypothetical protein